MLPRFWDRAVLALLSGAPCRGLPPAPPGLFLPSALARSSWPPPAALRFPSAFGKREGGGGLLLLLLRAAKRGATSGSRAARKPGQGAPAVAQQ